MDSATFAALVAALLGAGGISSLVAYRKAGREADSIAARTLIEVNAELRREIARRDQELTACRERIARLEERLNGHGL